jgi:hypothetical protein
MDMLGVAWNEHGESICTDTCNTVTKLRELAVAGFDDIMDDNSHRFHEDVKRILTDYVQPSMSDEDEAVGLAAKDYWTKVVQLDGMPG